MKRKILAWILLCAVLLSVFPLSVFAEEQPACPGLDVDHYKDKNCTSYTEIQTVPSVCGKQGHTLYECNTCNERFATPLPAIEGDGHSFETVEEEVPATCTATGTTKIEECSICHTKRGGEEIGALGHDMKEVDRTGSCLEAGVINTKCSRCDVTEELPIEATGKGHSWSENPTSIKTEPTWDKDGIAVYTCEVCKDTKEVTILALGHEHDMTHHEAVPSTCTEDGTVEYWSCSICELNFSTEKGEDADVLTDEELIDEKDGHVKGEKIADKCIPAVCDPNEPDPKDVFKCQNCDAEIEELLERPAHAYLPEPTLAKDPSCTTWGYTVEVCENCGDKNEIQTEKPLGHTAWGDELNEVFEESSMDCENDGTRTWECGRCSEPQSETVEKTGHTVVTVTVEATCVTYEYTFKYCSNEHCNKDLISTYTDAETETEYDVTVDGNAVHFIELDSVGTELGSKHFKFVEEREINSATCTENGFALGFCEACDKTDLTVVLPALGHDVEGVDWEVETPATCEAAGYQYKECKREGCGEKAVEEYPAAIGHDWVAGTPVAPTCEGDGYTPYTCANNEEHTKEDDFVEFEEPSEEENWYTTYQEAKAAHPGLADEAEGTAIREANCIQAGIYEYSCASCQRNVLIRVGETGGDGKHVKPDTFNEEAGEKAAKAPTCTEAGWTDAYLCTRCDTFIESEDIEALGHDVVVDEAVAPTCTETGLTEGSHCGRGDACPNEGAILVAQEKVAELGHDMSEATCTEASECQREDCDYVEGSALGHDDQVIDQRVGDCELYGYTHLGCVRCQDPQTKEYAREYIKDYVAAIGHDYQLDEDHEGNKTATCTETGIDMYVCANCSDEDPRETPALGHKNAAEETITESCTDTVTDRYCLKCETNIEKPHSAKETVEVEATCKEYGYQLDYCLDCGWSEISNVNDEYLADHPWTDNDWKVTTPPTQTEKGEETRTCPVCEETETRDVNPLAGIKYTLEVDNATVAGSDITDSSFIKVTVSVSGNDVAVQGLNFNLDYDANVLKFEKAEFVSESFTTLTTAHDNGDHVGVIAWTAHDISTAPTDHVVTAAAEAVVVLYFKVDYADAQTMTHEPYTSSVKIADDSCDTVNTTGKVQAEGDEAEFDIVKFLDVNKDGDITLVDVQMAIQVITGEAVGITYRSSIDTDKNGRIDLEDLQNLCNYIIGAATYEELEALGVLA